MTQYTTPTLELTVIGVDLTAADSVWVTVANTARNIIITKDSPILALDDTDTNVSVTFSQTETKQFAPNSVVDIQVNWMTGAVRCATETASITAFENLLKEVLP